MNPTGNTPEVRRGVNAEFPVSPAGLDRARRAGPARSPARGVELFLSGDLGISFFDGRGVGTNDIVNISNSGRSETRRRSGAARSASCFR
jgi:hypothetical protein